MSSSSSSTALVAIPFTHMMILNYLDIQFISDPTKLPALISKKNLTKESKDPKLLARVDALLARETASAFSHALSEQNLKVVAKAKDNDLLSVFDLAIIYCKRGNLGRALTLFAKFLIQVVLKNHGDKHPDLKLSDAEIKRRHEIALQFMLDIIYKGDSKSEKEQGYKQVVLEKNLLCIPMEYKQVTHVKKLKYYQYAVTIRDTLRLIVQDQKFRASLLEAQQHLKNLDVICLASFNCLETYRQKMREIFDGAMSEQDVRQAQQLAVKLYGKKKFVFDALETFGIYRSPSPPRQSSGVTPPVAKLTAGIT